MSEEAKRHPAVAAALQMAIDCGTSEEFEMVQAAFFPCLAHDLFAIFLLFFPFQIHHRKTLMRRWLSTRSPSARQKVLPNEHCSSKTHFPAVHSAGCVFLFSTFSSFFLRKKKTNRGKTTLS